LLHLLAALDTPTSGSIYFDSQLLSAPTGNELAAFRNREIAFVWQLHHLLADFTASENVMMPLLVRGAPLAGAAQAAKRWLAQVGLADRADHLAGELSGGEQQRVALARALVGEPRLLLADEPTGDLDEENAEAVFQLIERLHRAHRLTSILATHNSSIARRCERVLRLHHGKLEAVAGGSDRIGASPQS
jgi:lipoprotein-releasing system ATP-binding protein